MTKVLTLTSGGSIRVPSGNLYTLRADGNVYRNGARMPNTSGTVLLSSTPTPNMIYRKLAVGTWRSWDGIMWRPVATPAVTPASPAVTLSAPTSGGMTVTIAEVPDADGYRVQWRKSGTAVWATA